MYKSSYLLTYSGLVWVKFGPVSGESVGLGFEKLTHVRLWSKLGT